MSVRRLEHIAGFSIDRLAAAAGDDRAVLRLKNLDTDIPPPEGALEATRAAITLWENEEALRASEERANELRAQALMSSALRNGRP